MLADHERSQATCLGDPGLFDQVEELRPEVRALAPLRGHVETELHRLSSPRLEVLDLVLDADDVAADHLGMNERGLLVLAGAHGIAEAPLERLRVHDRG